MSTTAETPQPLPAPEPGTPAWDLTQVLAQERIRRSRAATAAARSTTQPARETA